MASITSNLSLVRNKVKKFAANVDQASRDVRDEMATALQQLAKEEIKGERSFIRLKRVNATQFRPSGSGTRKAYEKATAGEPPQNRTGNLRASITFVKTDVGFANYRAVIGPTAVYARAIELGGQFAPKSWQGTSAMAGFPFMAPAWEKFQSIAPVIIRKHFGRG